MYVEYLPSLSIATYTPTLETDTGLGQQEIQCKLQGDYRGGFLDKGGPSRRSISYYAGEDFPLFTAAGIW